MVRALRRNVLVGAALSSCLLGCNGSSNSIRIEIDPVIAVDPTAIEEVSIRVLTEGDGTDVTDRTRLTVTRTDGRDASLGSLSGANFIPTGLGGHAEVRAEFEGEVAISKIVIRLSSIQFTGGASESDVPLFDAQLDATEVVTVDYPESGVVLPRNIAPIEFQWSEPASALATRVRIGFGDVVAVTLYSRGSEAAFTEAIWQAVGESSFDEAVTVTIESADETAWFTAASFDVTVTADDLGGRVYNHGDAGTLQYLDLSTGLVGRPPGDVPDASTCNGCHRVSRRGSRLFYMGRVNEPPPPASGLNVFGIAERQSGSFVGVAAPTIGEWAGMSAWNADEENSRAALILPRPDPLRRSILTLIDPTTGLEIPSNLAEAQESAEVAGLAIVLPNWSSSGVVTFSAHDTQYAPGIGTAHFARLYEMNVSYDSTAGAFEFSPPLPVTIGGEIDSSDYYATTSFDGTGLAFTRARTIPFPSNPNFPFYEVERRVVVRDRVGGFHTLPGTRAPEDENWVGCMPEWAPTAGSRYTWLIYSSRRPYGHRKPYDPNLATSSHLWIAAVDLADLTTGDRNPGRPSFFVSGQDLAQSYVVPSWTSE